MTSEKDGSWWDQQSEYEGTGGSAFEKSPAKESKAKLEKKGNNGMLIVVVVAIVGVSLVGSAVFIAFSSIELDGSSDDGEVIVSDSDADGEVTDRWVSTNGTILESSQYMEDSVTWERTDSWDDCYWDDWEEAHVCDTYYETYYEDGYECTAIIDYEYTVNGTTYNDSESLLFENYSPCLDWVYDDYPRNSTVEVWYNEGDPQESSLSEPLEEMEIGQAILSMIFGGCCFVMAILGAIFMRGGSVQLGGSSNSAMRTGFRPRMTFGMMGRGGGRSRRRRSGGRRSGRRGSGGGSSRRVVSGSRRRSK